MIAQRYVRALQPRAHQGIDLPSIQCASHHECEGRPSVIRGRDLSYATCDLTRQELSHRVIQLQLLRIYLQGLPAILGGEDFQSGDGWLAFHDGCQIHPLSHRESVRMPARVQGLPWHEYRCGRELILQRGILHRQRVGEVACHLREDNLQGHHRQGLIQMRCW